MRSAPVQASVAAGISVTPLPAPSAPRACAPPVPAAQVASHAAFALVSGPSIMIEPNSAVVAGVVSSHVKKTRPKQIVVSFKYGKTRVYCRVVVARKSVVGPRQERRRRVETNYLVASCLAVTPAEIKLSMAAVYRQARANGGASVAHSFSLTIRQQTHFKVANRISGVLWSPIRSFLGGRASGLASREVVRSELSTAAAEIGAAVTTENTGAHLVSPRVALQALLNDMVAAGTFLECPLRTPPDA